MRYRFVLLVLPLCFLAVLSGCTLDDGSSPSRDSATARAGEDINLSIGSATLFINRNAIGTQAGQLPPGSRVSLTLAESKPDRRLYSPVYKIDITDSDGEALEGLNLTPAAVLEFSFDQGLAGKEGFSSSGLVMLQIDGEDLTELEFVAGVPAIDQEFQVVDFGRARARLTAPSRHAIARPAVVEPPPPQVALTGSTSTLGGSTIFQLADTAGTYAVTLALRNSDTDSPPTLVTLNDAAFNDANPFDPNNRVLTVQTGGNTYTTNAAAASVVVQLDTFSGTGSSGSMLGTVVRQGGSETLAINFAFTTGGAPSTALGGAVTEAGSRRTIAMTNTAGDQTVLLLMPDNLPNATLDPIVFDAASFNAAMPYDPASRLFALTTVGDTYISDDAAAGVTVTFSSFNQTDLSGAGTITGTAVGPQDTRSLNFSFTLVPGSSGGDGTLAVAPAVDIAGVAHECAAASNGQDYLLVRLADVGSSNRTLEYVFVDGNSHATFGAESYEPTVNLSPEGGFALAMTSFSESVLVAATGASASSATLYAIFFDPVTGTLLNEINLGIGARALVSYHMDQDLYVIAWQSGTNVRAAVFTFTGQQIGTTQTMFAGATLAGLAAAGDTGDEALITARSSSGVRGRYLEVSTSTQLGTAFDISSSGGGGMCVWESIGGRYLVTTQTLIAGFFSVRQIVSISAGATATSGNPLPLPAFDDLSAAAWGSEGAIMVSPSATLFAIDSSPAGVSLVTAPIYGSLQGGLNVDTSPSGPAIACRDDGSFLLASARGAGGVRLIPLTLSQ